MPRLSPIKAIKLLKILFKLGFAEIRQKGSHLILKHKDGRETVIYQTNSALQLSFSV